MTEEQDKLPAELIKQYGAPTLMQANELSALTLCLQALGTEQLTDEQREFVARQAGLHVAQLMGMLMSPEQSAKVVECAKRVDSALDTWMLDEIEKRDGLPPHG